jgi:hypothetical protein
LDTDSIRASSAASIRTDGIREASRMVSTPLAVRDSFRVGGEFQEATK